jgi:transcriptional regulator with XRE-family HTH domain
MRSLRENQKGGKDMVDKQPSSGQTFGAFFKDRRIRLGATLRDFCMDNKLDPGNLSKMERGLLPPPQSREKLEQYAKSLGLRKGSSEWFEFFDLAAAEAGRIPEDLQDEEVLRRLPVLFRTIRGTKLSDKQLDELIDRLRSE